MRRFEIGLVAALLTINILILSGCATVSNPYIAPDLPRSQSAILSGQKTVVYLVLFYYGKRVNISGIDDKQVPEPSFIMSPGQKIKLEPGVHTVKLNYWKKMNGSDTYSTSETPVTFIAEAGHHYEAQAKLLSPEHAQYSIFDKTTGETVSRPLGRIQQNPPR